MGRSLSVTIAYGIALGGEYGEWNIAENDSYDLSIGSWFADDNDEDFSDQAAIAYLRMKKVPDIEEYYPTRTLKEYCALDFDFYGVGDYASRVLYAHRIEKYDCLVTFDPTTLAAMETAAWDVAIGDFLTTLEITMKPGFAKPSWHVFGHYG